MSRQDLSRGQYRWTITFLDEGDDFDLQAEAPDYLSIDTGSVDNTGITITETKVRFGCSPDRHCSRWTICRAYLSTQTTLVLEHVPVTTHVNGESPLWY